MRPYSNLSPFQYSKGLVLILVLRLTPDFHNKPAPRKTTTASHSNKTTKKVLVNMVEIDPNGHLQGFAYENVLYSCALCADVILLWFARSMTPRYFPGFSVSRENRNQVQS
jgi:hypothetical protein